MAKLSSRGRTELCRLEKETDNPESDLTTWERKTVCLMSDRKLLTKRDVKFKPSHWETEPRRHSYGWKVAQHKGRSLKVKSDITVEQFISHYESLGYKRV